MKKKILIFTILGVLVFASALGAVAAVSNTPKNLLSRSIDNVIDGFLERDEFSPIKDIFEKGSIEFSFENTEVNLGMVGDFSAKGKLYFSNDAFMLSNFKLGNEEIGVSGDLYLSNKEIYIKENNILDGAYGLNLETILEDFKKSIFSANSGSEYALDEVIYESILTFLENIEEDEEVTKDAEKVLGKVYKKAIKIILNNAEISSETDEVRINRTKEKVRMIEIVIDNTAAKKIVEDFYRYLWETDDISDFIDKHEDYFMSIMGVSKDSEYYDEDFSLVEVYERAIRSLEHSIAGVCEEIEEDFEELEINVATSKFGAKLAKLEVEYGKETLFTLEIGTKGIEKTDKITLTTNSQKISYTISKNDKNGFIAEIQIKSTFNNDEIRITLNIDKEKETYSLTTKLVTNEHSLSGSYSLNNIVEVKGDFITKGDNTTVTIEKISEISEVDYANDEYDDRAEESIELNIKLVFDTNDKIPSPSKYSNIDEITDEDINEWINNLEELFK